MGLTANTPENLQSLEPLKVQLSTLLSQSEPQSTSYMYFQTFNSEAEMRVFQKSSGGALVVGVTYSGGVPANSSANVNADSLGAGTAVSFPFKGTVIYTYKIIIDDYKIYFKDYLQSNYLTAQVHSYFNISFCFFD
jgi:hypothetical protein